MSNIYENHYGTSFGFWLTEDTYSCNIVNDPEGSPKANHYYEKSGNTYVRSTDVVVDESKTYYRACTSGWGTSSHSFRDFGLYPKGKPVIFAPEVQLIQFEVPGRDGLYDASEALTGDIHYKNRTGKWEFTQTGGRKKWDSTYYWLKNKLHGQKKGIVIDEEQDGYYVGRITVEEPKYDDKKGIAYFTITADMEPWKNAWTLASEPWLWDPFSFENGVIVPYMSDYLIAEPGPTSAITWTVRGTRKPVVPHVFLFNASGDSFTPNIYLTVTVNGEAREPILLEIGDNVDKMPDLVIHQTDVISFHFEGDGQNGRGIVRVSYRNGWL